MSPQNLPKSQDPTKISIEAFTNIKQHTHILTNTHTICHTNSHHTKQTHTLYKHTHTHIHTVQTHTCLPLLVAVCLLPPEGLLFWKNCLGLVSFGWMSVVLYSLLCWSHWIIKSMTGFGTGHNWRRRSSWSESVSLNWDRSPGSPVSPITDYSLAGGRSLWDRRWFLYTESQMSPGSPSRSVGSSRWGFWVMSFHSDAWPVSGRLRHFGSAIRKVCFSVFRKIW